MSPRRTSTTQTRNDSASNDVVIAGFTAVRAPRVLRRLEFFLLLFALAVGACAVMLVDLGVSGKLQTTMLVPGILYALASFALHIVIRVRVDNADPLILPIATLLNALGIAMIYRIDLAEETYIDWSSTSFRQVLWSIVGIGCAITVLFLIKNHKVFFRYTYLFGFLAIVLLLLPLLPGIGREIGGARQWIALGPFSFQPVELSKIALAIFFAGYLVRNRDALSMVGKKIGPVQLPRGRDLGPLMIVWLIAMGVLVFQRELGTAVLVLGLFLAMLYVATGRKTWVLLGVSLFAAGGFLAARTFSYVQDRFTNWLDPWHDAQGASYQLVQGLFGMANGGITGTGLGLGYPQDTPLSQSDYILASLAEELGLVGIVLIFLCYLLFIARGLRIGFAGQDDFGKLFAAGLAFTCALQVFVVAGGLTRIIPLTGLTAPFLASGGSSLLSNWIIAALFVLMSDAVRSKPKLVIHS